MAGTVDLANAGRTRSATAASTKVARWLICASGKGGTSKTTTSLNLATIAASHGFKVALLDTDEQRTLTKWHLRREAGGFDVPKFQMFSIPLAEVDRAIREVAASDNVDLVIVDTPPGLEQQIKVRELLAHADFVLVPTTQSTADIDSAIEFMAIVSALKVKAAFLLSRTLQRWNTYRRGKLRLNRAGSLCPMDVRHLADIDSTHDHGLGINEFSAVKGGEDFEGVWDFVRKELGL